MPKGREAAPTVDPAAEIPDHESAIALLSSLGEVAYRWSIVDDRLYWDGDVQSVLGVPAEDIATGRQFASLLDQGSADNRHDAVFAGGSDRGTGVPFRVEYALRPGGDDSDIMWIEDFGRWYGDGSPQPQRAVGVIRVVSDRHERERMLTFRSSHDELTGFYNRARLIELVEEVLVSTKRFKGSAAFMLLAIDSFRLINDCYGFDVGDQVLASMAKRVSSRLRGVDAIGRFSGNKLGVVLRECSEETMEIAAQRFLDVAKEEVVTTDSGVISVSISIGGVTLPRNAQTVGEATARAEEALHRARQHGHGRFRRFVYADQRQAERRANATLSSELLRALSEERVCLAFQPIVGIEARKPVLYECLLRLRQTDGTLVEAASFMPLSERLGLSRLLDLRALGLALAALEERPDITLTVNVTADTTNEPEWLRLLESAAGRNKTLAPRLVVEITESTAIRNIAM